MGLPNWPSYKVALMLAFILLFGSITTEANIAVQYGGARRLIARQVVFNSSSTDTLTSSSSSASTDTSSLTSTSTVSSTGSTSVVGSTFPPSTASSISVTSTTSTLSSTGINPSSGSFIASTISTSTIQSSSSHCPHCTNNVTATLTQTPPGCDIETVWVTTYVTSAPHTQLAPTLGSYGEPCYETFWEPTTTTCTTSSRFHCTQCTGPEWPQHTSPGYWLVGGGSSAAWVDIDVNVGIAVVDGPPGYGLRGGNPMTADPSETQSGSIDHGATTNDRIAEPTDGGSAATPSPLALTVGYVSGGFSLRRNSNTLAAIIVVGVVSLLIV